MMKNTIKKLMAALLAVAMLCAMAVPALAAEDTTYTITINNPVGTYEAYQIFAGTLSEGGVLSNITWGSGVTADGQTALGVASEAAKALEEKTTDAKTFAVKVSKYLGTVAGSGTNEIPNLAPGYYLVKNKSVSENESYTSFILEVVKDVTVVPKSDKPSLEKKVKDINDSTSATTGWQDSADYDINDDVPFQLTTKVPTNFADYTSYKFVFHDEQSEGLTLKADTVKVKIGTIQLTTDQFSVDTEPGDACTFHVVINDLKNIPNISAGDAVVVKYESTLNNKAKIGEAGNPNEAYLEYSNNPYDSKDTTTTPKDKVTVFTYKVTVNKVDNENHALKGAAFALYKKIGDGENPWKLIALNNAKETADGYDIEDADKTTFEWTGLDDGIYKIVEIITPDSYNTIDDQVFTVTAVHETESADPKLTDLNGNAADGSVITFTPDKTAGSLTTNVVNQKGATLPSTGGMGTTLFYVVGGGLMVAAIVLLVTKKRMENK